MFPIIIILATLLILFYGTRAIRRTVFSALDNVPGPPRKSIITGHLTQLHNPEDSPGAFQQELEQKYGQVVKLNGLFGDRQLFVFDPAALESILVKDRDAYGLPSLNTSLNAVLWGKGILSTNGDDHRRYRKIMVPAFSTANLRGMIPLFYEVAQRTRDGLISPHVISTRQRLDMNAILCRTSLELIGQTGIGYSFDPMLPDQEHINPYAQALRRLIPAAFKLQLGFPFLPLLLKLFPTSFLRLMSKLIPLPALHSLRNVVDFLDATAAELVKERKAEMDRGAQGESAEDRSDIMSILVKANTYAERGMSLTDQELVACTSMIIFAATDTTSSSMNRMFHVLAEHPEVQEKLRAEILATPEQLDHDSLVALPYLDDVVREILRLAAVDSILPLSTPITGVDGKVMDSILVPKGTTVYVGISAANHNTQIWGEDALEFRPERWTNGKAAGVTTKLCGVYGNTMTFIGGGRSCIGFKFAQLEMKVVACVLLRAFRFSAARVHVQWRNTGIMFTPHVDNRSELPVLVERL
ncbi:cytochrome P450 [Mycena pura]|uniref:Cytochrome P450 n=1 Tax=Mycena pura TaxID=153505 RepID=A0AAD6UU74_9AGAR|nr:cytochrome P450 [Mycena pura]